MRALIGIIIGAFIAMVVLSLTGCASVKTSTNTNPTTKDKNCTFEGYALFLDINAATINACGAKTTQLNSAVNTDIATKLIETAIPLLKATTLP